MSPRMKFRPLPEGMGRVPERYPHASPSEYECVLDGQPLDVWVVAFYPQLQAGDVEPLSEAAAARLRTLTVAEARQALTGIDFPLIPPGAGLLDEVQFWLSPKEEAPDVLEVWFRINPRLERWDKPWSLVALAEVLEPLVQDDPAMRLMQDDRDASVAKQREWDLGIAFMHSFPVVPETLLEDVWQEVVPRGLALVNEAVRRLGQEEQEQHSVQQMFDFPVQIRAACEQYLVYFAQFLRDLGIEADAALTEHANRVLFSVTPRSGHEALQKVREALDAYLALAERPEVFDASGPTDIAVQQLGANVLHLRAQLQLAGAMLAARSAQIEALEITNARLRQFALPASVAGQVEEEPVVAGLLSVTPYEAKGVRVNLPEILRRLKRRFGE